MASAGITVEEITRAVRKAASESKDEATLRQNVHPLWEEYLRQNGSSLAMKFRHERVLANGRSDTVFNRLILEYKRPGSFTTKRKIADAHTQLRIYFEDLVKEERWRKERLLGVAFDGRHFLYLKHLGRWIYGEPVPLDEKSVAEFLRYLVKLTDRAALIPENLIRDFALGEDSQNLVAISAIRAFYDVLRTDHSDRTKALFAQWEEQFSDVHGAFDDNRRFDRASLYKSYGFSPGERVQLLPFFFALETYFSLFIKLLAYQVVGFYLNRKTGLPLSAWEEHGSEEFRDELENLDRGGIFREMKIRNFIEGDLFGWYFSEWSPRLERPLREVVRRLNLYDPETIEVEPEYTRDLLKQVYQYLIPRQIRHDLGEYYTPDWLAERVLNQLRYGEKDQDLLNKRVLDPGCGSGTFLTLAIKRAVAHSRLQGIPASEALRKVTANIQGFDLNPLAVIAARTNYLLALADLLPAKGSAEVTIPVYLCDSVKPPELEREDEGTLYAGEQSYKFSTSVGSFSFAAPLVNRQRIQRLAPLLEESVRKALPEARFLQRVAERLSLTREESERCKDSLLTVYRRLLELESAGVNGIWANIIKNAFAPLFCGTFDLVAGNPPWVNWEALPQHYRDATRRLWVDYGLFTLKGHAARLGGGKKDLSMLFTYRAIDRYLKDGGRLGFVITQTVFKSIGAGDGFRRFRLGPDGPCFAIEQVDDMVDLQPFEAATNRTVVFSARKGSETEYPVPWALWRRSADGGVGLRWTLAEVLAATKRSNLHGRPIPGSRTGPWMVAYVRALDAVRRVLGPSDYQARAGACTWLNGVYWVDTALHEGEAGLVQVRNLHDIGKKIDVPPVDVAIEPDLIFPLLRGREVSRWTATPKAFQIVPQNPATRTGYDEAWMRDNVPETLKYFDHFRDLLVARSGYKKYLQGDPFYSVYNVGPYTLAPFKVVWKEQSSSLECAVIGSIHGKVIVPDHKLMLVPFGDEREAHYVCALLNSVVARFVVATYAVQTQQSTHILRNVAVPQFDPQSELHRTLSRLSSECHEKASAGIPTDDVQEQIDSLASDLWGLREKELIAVRESLAILVPGRPVRTIDSPGEGPSESDDD